MSATTSSESERQRDSAIDAALQVLHKRFDAIAACRTDLAFAEQLLDQNKVDIQTVDFLREVAVAQQDTLKLRLAAAATQTLSSDQQSRRNAEFAEQQQRVSDNLVSLSEDLAKLIKQSENLHEENEKLVKQLEYLQGNPEAAQKEDLKKQFLAAKKAQLDALGQIKANDVNNAQLAALRQINTNEVNNNRQAAQEAWQDNVSFNVQTQFVQKLNSILRENVRLDTAQRSYNPLVQAMPIIFREYFQRSAAITGFLHDRVVEQSKERDIKDQKALKDKSIDDLVLYVSDLLAALIAHDNFLKLTTRIIEIVEKVVVEAKRANLDLNTEIAKELQKLVPDKPIVAEKPKEKSILEMTPQEISKLDAATTKRLLAAESIEDLRAFAKNDDNAERIQALNLAKDQPLPDDCVAVLINRFSLNQMFNLAPEQINNHEQTFVAKAVSEFINGTLIPGEAQFAEIMATRRQAFVNGVFALDENKVQAIAIKDLLNLVHDVQLTSDQLNKLSDQQFVHFAKDISEDQFNGLSEAHKKIVLDVDTIGKIKTEELNKLTGADIANFGVANIMWNGAQLNDMRKEQLTAINPKDLAANANITELSALKVAALTEDQRAEAATLFKDNQLTALSDEAQTEIQLMRQFSQPAKAAEVAKASASQNTTPETTATAEEQTSEEQTSEEQPNEFNIDETKFADENATANIPVQLTPNADKIVNYFNRHGISNAQANRIAAAVEAVYAQEFGDIPIPQGAFDDALKQAFPADGLAVSAYSPIGMATACARAIISQQQRNVAFQALSPQQKALANAYFNQLDANNVPAKPSPAVVAEALRDHLKDVPTVNNENDPIIQWHEAKLRSASNPNAQVSPDALQVALAISAKKNAEAAAKQEEMARIAKEAAIAKIKAEAEARAAAEAARAQQGQPQEEKRGTKLGG